MIYPFSALVGQEPLKKALLLNAADPRVGGVLISGEKGTAKSTAARALAALLPSQKVVLGCPFRCDPQAPDKKCAHCGELLERAFVESPAPFIDLPLGATEDRVLGALDFERALREGRRAFQSGLLAAAHRGILYIDEVNLLPDHLVDVLLDVAASGVNVVQREGIEVVHPARFLLIGTMNPEEGELRPQLLDRFALMVEVAGPRDPETRAEVVRRRIAFEADPESFARRWEVEQAALRDRIAAARGLLDEVEWNDDLLLLISRLCCEFGADGLRADIAWHKASRASAALDGRRSVEEDDVRLAAELVLPHRRKRRPFEKPSLDRQRLDDLMAEDRSKRGETSPLEGAPEESKDNDEADSGDPAGSEAESLVFETKPVGPARPIEAITSKRVSKAARGRRNGNASEGRGGYSRAVLDESPSRVAIDATMRSAAKNGLGEDGRPIVLRSDLHRKDRSGRPGTLILFIVDASGSMAARKRMEAVKGAVSSLLKDAGERRDRVGVIAFRGPKAELLLPPTDNFEDADAALRSLPTGGRTPLAHALALAAETIRGAHGMNPGLLPLPILLSDGKANVSLPDEPGDPWEQALRLAGELGESGVAALVLDTDEGYIRLGRAREIADAMGAEHLPLDDLTAESLVLEVRQPGRTRWNPKSNLRRTSPRRAWSSPASAAVSARRRSSSA